MNYTDFIKNVRQKNVKPIYFIAGPEDYFKIDGVSRLVNALLPDKTARDFNFDNYAACDVDLLTVINTANTAPLFSEKRLVVLRNLPRKVYSRPPHILTDYIKNPYQSTCLVITMEKGFNKDDKKRGLISEALVNGELISCYDVNNIFILHEIINEMLEEQKVSVTDNAMRLLTENVGMSVYAIQNEIEKIVSYYGGKIKVVDTEEVNEVSNMVRQQTVDDLWFALTSRNPGDVLAVVERLYMTGDVAVAVFPALARNIREFALCKGLMESGNLALQSAALRIGVYEFMPRYKALESVLKKYSLDFFVSAIQYSAELEYQYKRGRKPTESAVEELLLKFINFNC
ncbi:MAG: DNA polymerase III subunit delta [Elusimicrobiota bacterium]